MTLFRRALKGSTAAVVAIGIQLPPQDLSQTPTPTGEWSMIVDAQGNEIRDREPRPGDMLARRPPSYGFAGTEPRWERDPRLSDVENAAALIRYEVHADKNKQLLDKAIFLLYQTDDGARLLGLMKQKGFQLVFDPKKTAEENALGLCDYKNKLVPLAEGLTAEDVALIVKHELQHMEDIGNGLTYDNHHTLHSMIMADRALEGNARVSEAVLATESLIGSQYGPPQKFRTTALALQFQRHAPFMSNRMGDAMSEAIAGKWDHFAAHVLPGYYEGREILTDYDHRKLKHLEQSAPDIAALRMRQQTEPGFDFDVAGYERYYRHHLPSILTQDIWTHDKLADVVRIKGQPYLNQAVNFNPEDLANLSTVPEVQQRIGKLKERIQAIDPNVDKSAGLELPTTTATMSMTLPRGHFVPPPETQQREFQPIILPYNIDGHMTSSGQKVNALFGQELMKNFTAMKSGRLDFDGLHHAVSQHHMNSPIKDHNPGHTMISLLETGFRAPIGTFPPEYLHGLCARIIIPAQKGNVGQTGLKPAELDLIRHWHEMTARGLDPIFINGETKKKSYLRDWPDLQYWADLLAGATTSSQTPSQNPCNRPA